MERIVVASMRCRLYTMREMSVATEVFLLPTKVPGEKVSVCSFLDRPGPGPLPAGGAENRLLVLILSRNQ